MPSARRRGAGGAGNGRRSALLAAEEVEADDLAGRMAVNQVAAERVDLQRDDRPGQPGAPAHVAGRIHHGQLALEGRRRDRAAGEVGDGVRHRAAQVIRPFVPAR